MRLIVWLLALTVLVLVGAFPVIAAVLAGAVALAVSGAVALLTQPPILLTALVAVAAVATRRRFV